MLGDETQTPSEGTVCSCSEVGAIPAVHLPAAQDTRKPTTSAAFPEHPHQAIPARTQLWGVVFTPKSF